MKHVIAIAVFFALSVSAHAQTTCKFNVRGTGEVTFTFGGNLSVGGPSCSQQAATPTFSPAAGTYTSAQTVTISDATAGATIYYTTDGSTPTTGSTIYSTALSVSSTTTVKAIAAAAWYTNSAVGSAAYTITSSGPLWTGVLAPSRAMDWSKAGLQVDGIAAGKIPSVALGYTQCGTTIAPIGALGSPVAVDPINAAIAACSPNTYVLLGTGNFYLTGTISLKSQVVLRGMGANATSLIMTTIDTGACDGYRTAVCAAGSTNYVGGEQNTASWTAGFAQGTNTITLSNSLNITAGSTILTLDQQDEANDTGNIWNCLAGNCSNKAFTGGFARTDGTCSSTVSPNVGYCSQQQQVLITSCSPSCNNAGSTVLTLAEPLAMPNWRLSQSTGAWWATTTIYRAGFEDMSVDISAPNDPITGQGGVSAFFVLGCYECWVSGNRSIMAARNHIDLYQSAHSVVQYNYAYQSISHSSVSYGIEIANGSDNLVLANICQQVTDSCPSNTGGGTGNVAAYNTAIYNIFTSPGWMQANDYDHASGTSYWLREGNSSIGFISDMVHGTHHFTSLFRNYFRGWQGAPCDGTACNSETIPVHPMAGSRYFNVVGNVLGQAGYHNTYQCINEGLNGETSIFVAGELGDNCSNAGDIAAYCQNPTPSGCGATGNNDVFGVNSLMRWGNYDTVSAAVRWVSGEVPSTLEDTTGTVSAYAAILPSTEALPNSFLLSVLTTSSSTPCGTGLWFNNNPTRSTCEPFPYYGPDVTSGDLGTCTSGTYAGSVCRVGSAQCGGSIACAQAMAGHANLNPTHSCFLDVMGGAPDGTGSILTFNRAACYALDPTR